MNLTETFLELLTSYGYSILAATIFGAAVSGIPLPITVLLLASGAFAAQGDFNLGILLLVTWLAAVAGDSVSYGLGAWGGNRLLQALQRHKHFSSSTLVRALGYLDRWGGGAIFLSRFLLTPLAVVLNLLAGTTRYSFRRFVAYIIAGEAMGNAPYVLLGYGFGASWPELAPFLSSLAFLLAGLVITVVLGIVTFRYYHRKSSFSLPVELLVKDEEVMAD